MGIYRNVIQYSKYLYLRVRVNNAFAGAASEDSLSLFFSGLIRCLEVLGIIEGLLYPQKEFGFEVEFLRAVVDKISLDFSLLAEIYISEIECALLSAVLVDNKDKVVNRSGTDIDMLQ